MSSKTCRFALAIALALAMTSCGRSEKSKPISATIEIEAVSATPAATMTIELPGGWHAHDVFPATWLPDKDAFKVSVKAQTSCGGECSADKIAENIAAEMKSDLLEYWTQGDTAHLKPTVELVDSGALPLGHYRAFRLAYPEAPKGKAQGRSGTHLECYIANPGDAFYVKIEATAIPKEESQIWPALLDACKGASYVAAK